MVGNILFQNQIIFNFFNGTFNKILNNNDNIDNKNMLRRSKESDTYLATVRRHRWSRQIMMKIDQFL
jgi:hypothetical protein